MLFQPKIIVTVNIGRMRVWNDNPFIFQNPSVIARIIFTKIAFITNKITGIDLTGNEIYDYDNLVSVVVEETAMKL